MGLNDLKYLLLIVVEKLVIESTNSYLASDFYQANIIFYKNKNI